MTFPSESLLKDVKDELLPPVRVVFYRDDDGKVPMVQWVEGLQKKPREKCFEWIERLMTFGYEFHRPHADTLKDGICDLRLREKKVRLRMLYFFFVRELVVVTQGTKNKTAEVSQIEIDRALE